MMRLIALIIALAGAVASALSLRWLTKSREDTSWPDARRPGKILTVDGVGLHYVERGEPNRPAIVMVHGFGGHTFSFRYQLEEFAKDYRAVAIDLKGFGYSERAPGNYGLAEQARLVLGAMDVLGIDKATLIGHSMGGAVAMRIAAMAPERVERLVLAASVSGQRVPFAPRPRFIKPFMPGLSRLVMVRNFGKKMFYDPSTVDSQAIRAAYMDAARVKGSMDTVWNMWTDVPKDAPIEYERITQPVLILAAEKERVIPFYGRAIAYLRSKLPQARILTVERTGHLMLEERPGEVNRLIGDFISETTAPSQAPAAATTAA